MRRNTILTQLFEGEDLSSVAEWLTYNHIKFTGKSKGDAFLLKCEDGSIIIFGSDDKAIVALTGGEALW